PVRLLARENLEIPQNLENSRTFRTSRTLRTPANPANFSVASTSAFVLRRRRDVGFQKLHELAIEHVGRLHVQHVTGARHEHELRAGNRVGDVLRQRRKVRTVFLAADYEALALMCAQS